MDQLLSNTTQHARAAHILPAEFVTNCRAQREVEVCLFTCN